MDNRIFNLNILVLAYLGDSVYENYVRRHLIEQGFAKVNDLQKASISFVSAVSQAKFIRIMINSNFFNEFEFSIVKRARNYKTTSHPKNCDIITYKYATALEALVGYYDLINNNERIDEIMNFIFNCEIC